MPVHRSPRLPSCVSLLTRTARSGGVLVLLVASLFVSDAEAQRFSRIEDTQSNVAYFYHAKPGEATVQVSVWGAVKQSGIYEVPDSTRLDKLLTMAGGAPLQIRQEGREPAEVNVYVYRPTSGRSGGDNQPGTDQPDTDQSGMTQTLLFSSSMDAMLEGDVSYPTFRDDDIVVIEVIEPRQRFTWRDALQVLTSVGTLTLVGLRIFGRR